MDIKERLADYFKTKNIEYYSVLSYEDCKETEARIIAREDFTPKSVIIYLLPYYAGETVNISRYAASRDYHLAIREVNSGLSEIIKEECPAAHFKGYGDHSPINECHATLIAGLGILGDNGLIINEKYGSYVFVGDMITDIPADILGAKKPCKVKHCEHCGACKQACPTGIIRSEGEDCLSAITQKKGELSCDEAALIKKYSTAWGCDICQSSCPHNRHPEITPIEFFKIDRIPYLTTEVLRGLDKEHFNQRAFAWRGRKTVERNIKILFE